ncbi:MAG TPA: hypothetical protein VFP72_14115, partial [Kineosporiaceae bacterium]|nr:hypothetical protein [Kineosporiaceae bacterium]
MGIASVDTWLPQTVETVDEAVRAGRLSADDAAGAGARQVPVSPALSPPEMAVLAAGKALARAEWSAAELDLLAHAWIYHQGHDFWSPAHYVAAQIGASRAVPLGLQQLCNGGAAALLLGARWVAHAPAPSRVAVTTADRFWGPGFDRWAGD